MAKKEKSYASRVAEALRNSMKTPGQIQAEADKGKKASRKVKNLGFLPDKKKRK